MTWRSSLPWLPMAPKTFRSDLKAVERQEWETSLVQLSMHALDVSGLHALHRCAVSYSTDTPSVVLDSINLQLVSDVTTALLAPCISATGLRYRLNIVLEKTLAGDALQSALTSRTTDRSHSAFALALLDHRSVPGLREPVQRDETAAVEEALEYIRSVHVGLAAQRNTVILHTLPVPPESLLGSGDARAPGSRSRRIAAFNFRLASLASEWGVLLLDAASLAASVGSDEWFDDVQWVAGKFPFSQKFAPLYAEHVVRLIAAARGKARKCLVLDLDNVLWGGVLGEDGLSGIAIGHGNAISEAYLTIQQTALALRQRGVLLAVSSKNDEALARLPFQQHPDMLLKEEHFTVFLANWRDKATNLEAIAKALGIGLDSLVLLDDNPAERMQVRGALPLVAVPELPDDPSLYSRTLLAAGYFESTSYSPEDSARAQYYQLNAQRALAASAFRNLDEYLQALEMVATFTPFDKTGRSRIAQLILRSNQFNLTVRRYSEREIEEMACNPAIFTMQVRLSDRFGNNGMISVVICKIHGAQWTIDTWLMSCRVLNRRVEEAVLDVLVRNAVASGALRLEGLYVATPRNALVKDHYSKLGFTLQPPTDKGVESWALDLRGYIPKSPPIRSIGPGCS